MIAATYFLEALGLVGIVAGLALLVVTAGGRA